MERAAGEGRIRRALIDDEDSVQSTSERYPVYRSESTNQAYLVKPISKASDVDPW